MGAPGDAGTAFAEALRSAAKRGLPEPAPDPRVAAAFALGWQVAVLYRPERRRAATPADPDDLPELGRLTELQFLELGLAQAQVAIVKLHESVEHSGLELPDVPALRKRLAEAGGAPQRRAVIQEIHVRLTTSLGAVDFRLGKAYGLGRAVADTCRNPDSIESLRAELAPARVATLVSWIDDLGSAFPPHAGHSVRESVRRWERWAGAAGEQPPDPEVWALLRRQGGLWRALLSGEKLATDMLETKNYLDAAETAFVQMRTLTRSFARHFPILVATVAVLFLGGVVLVVLGAIFAGSTSVVAGLGGVLASLGLSWRGIGGSLGRLAGQLERPLWGAAIDAVITEAITLVPDADDRVTGGRRTLATTMQKPAG